MTRDPPPADGAVLHRPGALPGDGRLELSVQLEKPHGGELPERCGLQLSLEDRLVNLLQQPNRLADILSTFMSWRRDRVGDSMCFSAVSALRWNSRCPSSGALKRP